MSRELPILFNGDMVRAILDGRKTVTRRPVRRDVSFLGGRGMDHDDPNEWGIHDEHGCTWVLGRGHGTREQTMAGGVCSLPSPYDVGDRLYVRETFHSCPHCHNGLVAYRAGGWRKVGRESIYDDRPLRPKCEAHGWRPSIHMPKWAARLWLRVTDVRAERLSVMVGDDCLEEGFRDPEPRIIGGVAVHRPRALHEAFCAAWDAMYAAKGFGVEADPWVWRYGFEVET